MKILAVEFSSGLRGVAACEIEPGSGLVKRFGLATEVSKRSGRAVQLVEEALRGAGMGREEIDHFAAGLGPGSYTGIRAALALVRGWQLGRPAVVAGISTVEALAAQALAGGYSGRWNVIIDAQRRELYLAGYEFGPEGATLTDSLRIVTEAELRERAGRGERFFGPEAELHVAGAKSMEPSARALAELAARRGRFSEGDDLEPVYLREVQFVKAPAPRIL